MNMEITELVVFPFGNYTSFLSDLNSFHISKRESKFWDLPLFCFPSLTLEFSDGLLRRSDFERIMRNTTGRKEYPIMISYLIPSIGDRRIPDYNRPRPTTRINRFSDFHTFLYRSCVGQVNFNSRCILSINQKEETHDIFCAQHGCIVSKTNKILLVFCIKVDSYMNYFSHRNTNAYAMNFRDLDKVIWVSEELFESSYGTFSNRIFNNILKPFIMRGGEVKMFTKEELNMEFYTSKNIKKTLFRETFKELIKKEESLCECSDIQDVITHNNCSSSLYMKL